MTRRRLTSIAVATTLSVVLGACGSKGGNTPTSAEIDNRSVAPTRADDDILRFGLLIPLTDPAAPFGPDLVPVMEGIVGIMNNFGGYLDTEIELVVRDEGSTAESATAAVAKLVGDDNVDAVVGPFSALTAPSAVPLMVSSGVAACSPTVPTAAMDYLDDDGLFFRTATLDTDIVKGMVDLAAQSGRERVSVAYPEDPYGRGLLRELKSALATRNLVIATEVSYSVDDDNFLSEVARLTSDSAQVEMLIGDPVDGPRFLNALAPAVDGSVIIVNDGLANATVNFDTNATPEARPRIFGTAPDTILGNDDLLNIFGFSTSDYLIGLDSLPNFTMTTLDCFVLIWLAALTARSDNAQDFKDAVIKVANDGSRCNWLFDCSFLFVRTLNLDYEGVSSLTLDERGNAVNRGTIYFQFDDDGRVVPVSGTPNFGFAEPDPFAPLS